MSPFKQKVIMAVKMVPFGRVASYGQIALMVGVPRAARQVGWVLNSLEEDIVSNKEEIPWWRIVNNAGRISIKGTKYHDASMQKTLLEQEGIVIDADFTFDIKRYRFRPNLLELRQLELVDEYIQMLVEKFEI